MQSERFQRPNILGFCLMFVGNIGFIHFWILLQKNQKNQKNQ
jgi:hypothetical protein